MAEEGRVKAFSLYKCTRILAHDALEYPIVAPAELHYIQLIIQSRLYL